MSEVWFLVGFLISSQPGHWWVMKGETVTMLAGSRTPYENEAECQRAAETDEGGLRSSQGQDADIGLICVRGWLKKVKGK